MKVVVGIVATLAVAGLAAASGATWLVMGKDADALAGHARAQGASAAGGGPTAEDALGRLERLGDIRITTREGFNPENGVRGGSGTIEDPYLFEGFYAPRMTIEDVEAAYVIRDVYVSGTMRLDYTGATARIERSTIGFLLTDTNRPHEAPHTWLDVRGNTIGAARIRHAGGEVVGNTIGAHGNLDPDRLALEVQGYNGLLVARNVVHGPVELRLHGHHFTQGFGEAWTPMPGHDHGDPAQRFHEVRVVGNEFHDASGRGVAISDRDHAANHATAKSAPDPRLDLAHRHELRFHFEENTLRGAGLVVEKPNASDPRHTGGSAWIHVRANRIVDPLGGVGIDVRGAQGAHVELDANLVGFSGDRVEGSAGILLQRAEGATLVVRGGLIRGFDFGVKASHLKAGTAWSVEGVAFEDVGREIYWDKSVKTRPGGGAPPRAPGDGHEHHARA